MYFDTKKEIYIFLHTHCARRYHNIILIVNKIISSNGARIKGHNKRIVALSSLLYSSDKAIPIRTLQNLDVLKDPNINFVAILSSCESSTRKCTL